MKHASKLCINFEIFEKRKHILIRSGEWSFKNSESRKSLVEFHESRSLVYLAHTTLEVASESRYLPRLRVYSFVYNFGEKVNLKFS